jgi:hypothetical protein
MAGNPDEYVKCGNLDCENSLGPHLYAYWKQDKKLKKRHVAIHRRRNGIGPKSIFETTYR